MPVSVAAAVAHPVSERTTIATAGPRRWGRDGRPATAGARRQARDEVPMTHFRAAASHPLRTSGGNHWGWPQMTDPLGLARHLDPSPRACHVWVVRGRDRVVPIPVKVVSGQVAVLELRHVPVGNLDAPGVG